MNTTAKVEFSRSLVDRRERYNPIANLTPEVLTRQIEEFKSGYLVPFARTMEAIKNRDDVIQPAAAKREKAPSRRTWEIITSSELAPADEAIAEQHKEALHHFYDNLLVTSAIDLNEQGGVELLLRQRMQAVGYKYSVHHIVWQPAPDGLTARLIHCPLWFFENRTGRLRFLQQSHTLDGVEMIPGEWLVAVGDGIMEVSSVCYMFKRLPLKDWLIMSQDFGKPVVQGVTDAAEGSGEWETLKDAVEVLAADLRIVRSRSAEIVLTDLQQQGTMPYEPLVERMDRRLAAIWRGGDLGTVSRADAVGAEGQAEESDLLEEDDCMWLTGGLNQELDRLVIANVFGEGTKPLAYFKVVYPRRQNVTQDLAVDTFLRDSGVPLGIDATLERYGRSRPDDGDETLRALPGAAMPAGAGLDAISPGATIGGGAEVQSTALNGAQVTALANLAAQVAQGQLPFDTGLAVATAAFPAVPPATINKIFDALRRFKPTPPLDGQTSAANEATPETIVRRAVADAVGARETSLAPLSNEIDRLARLAANTKLSDADFTRFLEEAANTLPELFGALKPGTLADSIEAALGTAVVEGVRDEIAGEPATASVP